MCCKGFSSSIQRILPIAIIVLIGNVNVVANCGDKIASSPPDSVELNAEVMNPEWDLRSTDSIMISWGNPVQRILCYNKKIRATGHHGHSMDWRMDDNTLVVAAIPKAEKYTVIFSFQGKQRGAELIGTGGKVKLKDWAWPAPPALAIAPVHAPTPVPVVVPTTTTTPSATTTPAPVVIPTTTTVPSTAPTSARVIVPTTTTIPSTTPTPAATATTQPEAPAPMNSTPAIEPSKPGIRPMKKGLIVNKGDSCTVAAGLAVFYYPVMRANESKTVRVQVSRALLEEMGGSALASVEHPAEVEDTMGMGVFVHDRVYVELIGPEDVFKITPLPGNDTMDFSANGPMEFSWEVKPLKTTSNATLTMIPFSRDCNGKMRKNPSQQGQVKVTINIQSWWDSLMTDPMKAISYIGGLLAGIGAILGHFKGWFRRKEIAVQPATGGVSGT